MEFPTLIQGDVTRENLTQFGGYNACARINDGEFAAMENGSGDAYPLFSTRHARGIYARPAACNGLIAKDSLCWVDGGTFVMNGLETDLRLTDSPKRLVSMGAYVVIFPDKKYINTADLSDYGNLEAEFTTDGTVTITPVDAQGAVMLPSYIQPEEPKEPENGVLWLDTTTAEGALLQWSAGTGMWVSVTNTLVKLSYTGIGAAFQTGDGVSITGAPEGVTTQGVIADRGDDYITVSGLLSGEQTVTDAITVERFVPNMDYVIECGNRLWGCRYGLNRAGEVVNEIYASKLGDFRNWNCFQGVSTDSYTVSCGADGPFTAAVQHLGYPVFFREGCIHKLYGSYPAAYRLQTTTCPGVQQGSAESLALVGQMLYYKSPTGVCAYDGAMPVDISQNLGTERYTDAVGGSLREKYYLSMLDASGTPQMFVYDTAKGFWHREDSTRAAAFCTCRGELYFLRSDGAIVSVSGQGEAEEDFPWMLETGDLGGLTPDYKQLSRLNLRMELQAGTEARLWVRYDNEEIWQPIARIRGSAGVFTLPVAVRRCTSLRLKLAGTGAMRLYGLTKTMEEGSDVP